MSTASEGTGFINRELCGEGFRDIRGLINCKGCGLKFRSGAEFGKHAKGVEDRKRSRQEISEQMMVKGRQGDGRDTIANSRDATAMQRGSKSGVVEEQRGERARIHVRMPGQEAVGMPGQAAGGMQGPSSNTNSSKIMPQGQRQIHVTPGLVNTGMTGSTEPSMSVPRCSPAVMSGHAPNNVPGYSHSNAASSSGPGHVSAGVPEHLVHELGNMGEIPPHIGNMHYTTNVPTILPSPHPVVTQQILQQQQQLALQQEQQQQLIILRQQLQQQQNVAIPALPSQATPYPVLPQQHQVSDRDRQIALLEKELRIQKMMLEVERREAMLREQATLLSAQEERMKQEQLQALRYRAAAGGTEVLVKCGGGEQDNGGLSLEKARQERMYEVMEMKRKEARNMEPDLKNVRLENKNSPNDEINVGAGKRKSGKLQKSEVSYMRDLSASKVAVDAEDDVFPSKPGFPFDDSDMLEVDDADEQRKILEAIKRRNEEKKKEEELTMRLITKLSLDESEELPPQNLDDGWPELSEAVPGAGESVRDKIERLKRMAERRGMCVNSHTFRDNMEPPASEHTYSKEKH